MSFIPNTTPTPNWLYNGEMKKMNETELKVVLLITRKTLGWFDPMTEERKIQDYISQSQFMEFTGQSNRAIATAIQVCVECGWIIAKDKKGNLCNTSKKRQRRKVWYQLGSVFTNKISSEESSQEQNLVNKVHQSSEQNDTNLVKKVHNTKETLTKETFTTISASGRLEKKIPLCIKIGLPKEKWSVLIDPFEKVNPVFKKIYQIIPERNALAEMCNEFGFEKTLEYINLMVVHFGTPYGPTITKPTELLRNLGKLIGFDKKESQKNNNKHGNGLQATPGKYAGIGESIKID